MPVLLHNNKFAEPVEGIVEGYSLPGKGELDPTAVTAPFYYLLFGLMLSDAAYGIILIVACAIAIKKCPNMEAGMKKTLKMFLYCGISTTFWGFMFGSFFGDAVNVIATHIFQQAGYQPAASVVRASEPADEDAGIFFYLRHYSSVYRTGCEAVYPGEIRSAGRRGL